jgi:hypothetical protein
VARYPDEQIDLRSVKRDYVNYALESAEVACSTANGPDQIKITKRYSRVQEDGFRLC